MHIEEFFKYLFTAYFHSRILTNTNYRDIPIVAVVNVVSKEIEETASIRHLKTADGVILTEAIRYAVSKFSSYISPHSLAYTTYDITDLEIPFHGFYPYPFLSVASSRQTLSYLNLRKKNPNGPYVDVFPFNEVEEGLSELATPQSRKFFSVVPPVRFEIEAILDILSHLQWKYVTVIVPRDENGE